MIPPLSGYAQRGAENYNARETQEGLLPKQSPDVTTLLRAWSRGDGTALERLTPLIYDELRRLARGHIRRERAGHSLPPTGLVNEAYLRLVDASDIDWQNRTHFLSVSSRIMRRVLIDAARRRAAQKRDVAAHRADGTAVDVDRIAAAGSDRAATLCALDDALEALARLDPRRAQVIELRFFGGLSVDETAGVLAVSPQTVMRDWKLARAWLMRELRHMGGNAR
jgi:RNA polymerase sigma factor (TIGR02999 family)